MVDNTRMKAILHITTGDLVYFIKCNFHGKQMINGVYHCFETATHGRWFSVGFKYNDDNKYKFRYRLLDNDDPKLLIHSICNHGRFLQEEFAVVDIVENSHNV